MYTKALVVDDNYFNRDLARLALENSGYEVTEAENGIEALRILEREPFALLILDLAMPELDGLGVISALRQNDLYRDMRIIVVTAHAHMSSGSLELDVDFVMHKPIDINSFRVFLDRLRS